MIRRTQLVFLIAPKLPNIADLANIGESRVIGIEHSYPKPKKQKAHSGKRGQVIGRTYRKR